MVILVQLKLGYIAVTKVWNKNNYSIPLSFTPSNRGIVISLAQNDLSLQGNQIWRDDFSLCIQEAKYL